MFFGWPFEAEVPCISHSYIRLSPLIRTLHRPCFFQVERFKSEAEDSSGNQVCDTSSRIFDRPGDCRATGLRGIVAPTGDGTPFSCGLSIVQPDMRDRSRRSE